MENNHAFGLPRGSIRAILALIIFGITWFLLIKYPNASVPSYLQNLLFIIMGHYFASRTKSTHTLDTVGDVLDELPGGGKPKEYSPLFLPRGTIRTLLLLGFLTVAVVLGYNQQLWGTKGLSNSAISLILIFGFIFGVIRSNFSKPPTRFVEDVRASVAIVSAIILCLIVLNIFKIGTIETNYNISFHVEEILAGIVGFYFGSRS